MRVAVRRRTRLFVSLLTLGGLGVAGACGGGGSNTPTNPTPPAPTTFSLGGTVISFGTGGPVTGVRVEIIDGTAAGRTSTTDAAGRYNFTDLTAGNFNVRATAERFKDATRAIALSANQTTNIDLRRAGCGGADVSCALAPTSCNESMPMLRMPFNSDPGTVGSFDHDLPLGPGTPQSAEYMSYCGATGTGGRNLNGLNGWNFDLRIGDPVVAAAAGTVTIAGDSAPAPCPVLGRDVATRRVEIEHRSPFGERIWTQYIALSSVAVAVGQTVTAGQVIGASGDGNTGCTNRELLGFVVLRERTNGPARQWIDPYGWQGPGEDAWSNDASGTASVWMWTSAPRFTPLGARR